MSEIIKKNNDTIAINRRAKFDYQISETIEVGIVLTGTEVKSLRQGKANIGQCYAGQENGELWIFGAQIDEYAQAGRHLQHDPKRNRKLLAKKKELDKLIGNIERHGMTLVPMSLYFNGRGIVKLKLGIAKGKKQHEKRDAIKDRDWKRDQARILKNKA
jgi:SsrA-binding protein